MTNMTVNYVEKLRVQHAGEPFRIENHSTAERYRLLFVTHDGLASVNQDRRGGPPGVSCASCVAIGKPQSQGMNLAEAAANRLRAEWGRLRVGDHHALENCPDHREEIIARYRAVM